MRLVNPSATWRVAFQDMAREWEGESVNRYALALADFDTYVRKLEARRRGEDLPEGWVPGAELWLEHDGYILGCGRIRFALTPALENEGGHIGYDIRPSVRGRGHATALLGLLLVEARAFGVERVRITCDEDNAASAKVIERNGGALSGRGLSPETGRVVLQYWVASSRDRV